MRRRLLTVALLVATAASAKIYSDGFTVSRSLVAPTTSTGVDPWELTFLPDDGGALSECDPAATYAAASIDGGTIALTFSRDGGAWCTKANRDMVFMAASKPRMHLVGGKNALIIEDDAVNLIKSSNNLTNNGAPWGNGGSITVNADYSSYGTAPDGTTTQDRLSKGGAPYTAVHFHTYPIPGAGPSVTYSVYCKSDNSPSSSDDTCSIGVWCSSGGTLSLCTCETDDGTSCSTSTAIFASECWAWKASPFAATRFGRIALYATCSTTVEGASMYPGQIGVNAGSVQFWQADMKNGLKLTSPITTTGTAAPRAKDVAYFSGSFPLGPTPSFAVSVKPLGAMGTDYVLTAAASGTDRWQWFYNAAGQARLEYAKDPALSSSPLTGTLVGKTEARLAGWYDGASLYSNVGGSGSGTAASFSATSPVTTITLGTDGDAEFRALQLSNNPTVAR